MSDYLEQQQLNHPYPLLIKEGNKVPPLIITEGNKVSPLIQGGLRGVNGLPDTTGKQCDKVELMSRKNEFTVFNSITGGALGT